MRQSITTKYHGAANVRGSRVSATASSGPRIVIEWDDEMNTDRNHEAAARKLAEKLGWEGQWIAGCSKDGCVWVLNDSESFTVQRRAA